MVASRAALILIDLQKAIDDPSWGQRNNPRAEANASALLDHWRQVGWPVFHVRHDSVEPGSTYRPEQPLHAFKPETAPREGEPVIAKCVNSAFIGTDLTRQLTVLGLRELVMAGVITNNSVEATVRTGGNLGYRIWLAEDACFTFGRKDWRGVWRTADEVHAMSLANLDGEYCEVVETASLLDRLRGRRD